MPKRHHAGGGQGKNKKFQRGGGNFDPNTKFLMPGNIGWLVSHDRGKERAVMLNCYDIMNYYNPKKVVIDEAECKENETPVVDSGDVASDLAAEIAALQKTNTPKKDRPAKEFQKLDAGANCLLFIKCETLEPDDIHSLTQASFLEEDRALNVRGISRIIPVIASCKVAGDSEDDDRIFDTLKDLLKSSTILGKQYVRKELGGTYVAGETEPEEFKLCLDTKVRNNSKVDRRTLQNTCLKAMQSIAPGITFDYNDKTHIFHIDLMKTVCCFSFMLNYEKFNKYNIFERQLAIKQQKDASLAPQSNPEANEKVPKIQEQKQAPVDPNPEQTC